MSCTIIVAHNPLDRDSWIRTEDVSDLGQFILDDFAPFYGDVWPASARIYLESIDGEHDITPVTPPMAEALRKVEGTVYIVVWPQGAAIAVPILVNFGIAMAIHVIRGASGDDRLRAGGPRKGTNPNLPKGSPNNIAGERRNTARIEERIPDIYGRVRSTPDLIQVPYISYVNNLQQEISYMCVGRGDFVVLAADVREDDTRVDQLLDTSIEIYPSGQAPGGGTPQLTIGQPIGEAVFTVVPINSVKGELLQSPNQQALYGDDLVTWQVQSGGAAFPAPGPFMRPVKFFYPSSGVGTITLPTTSTTGGQPIDLGGVTLQDRFPIGTKFGMEWTVQSVTVAPVALTTGSGGIGNVPDLRLMPDTPDDICYTVTGVSVTATDVILTISVPVSKQAEWSKLIAYNPSGTTGVGFEVLAAGEIYNTGCILYPLTYRLGPYFVDDEGMEFVKLNFVADKGLYTSDGRTQSSQFRDIVVEITPASSTGTATGAKEVFSFDTANGPRITGSPLSRDFIGLTFNFFPSFTGRFLISVYNQTNTLNRHSSWSWQSYNRTHAPLKPWDGATDSASFKGEVQDEIHWTHGYSMSTVPNISFGGVTTVQAKVVQRKNQRPSEVDRKLNMIVTRKLAAWNGTILTGFAANQTGRDALFQLLKDFNIGNIPDAQIDFAQIAAAFLAVTNAFGDARATNFDHTFDSDNLSLEDLIAAICDSCFLQAYRESNVVKASPDISSQSSTLLFNHRNKVPNSETRSVSFATEENYDGVKVQYADDTDGRIKNFVIPTEGATTKTKQLAPAGTRTKAKAVMHAWRAFNELQYKNTYVEFDSCEEAALTLVNDRIIVADNTRPETQDGDILNVVGLTVTTSQQVIVATPSVMFVQHTDGTTEAIQIALQNNPNSIVLGNAPALPLYVDAANGIYPRYTVVPFSNANPKAFRVLEKSYKGPGVFSITAWNYSEGYYFDDGIHFRLAFKNITGSPSIGAFTDRGPYDVTMSAQNGVGTTTDVTRGQVYNGAALQDHINVGGSFTTVVTAFTSYTIACWINRASNANHGFIFSSSAATSLMFDLTATTNFARIFHNNVQYLQTAISLNTWEHVAVTYDAVALKLSIYRNGDLVNTATSVPNFNSLSSLRIFGNVAFTDGIVGKADDFRLYHLAKSDDFIKTLYQKTLIV